MLLNYIKLYSLTTYKFIRIKKRRLFKSAVIGDSGANSALLKLYLLPC